MASTSETILSEMIESVDSKYDTSKGSWTYDILNSGAIKFAQYDESIDTMVERRFATTATGKDLQYAVADQGVEPKTSTKSTTTVTITGIAGSPVSKGEKVATDSVNFIFTQDRIMPDSKTVDVPVECEKYGTVGNVPAGAIKYFPKTLAGLQTVTNKEEVTNGYDSEDDDSIKERFFKKVQTPATSGNPAQYELWAESLNSVGKAKCIRCWNGNGTVKVVIVDANMQPASDDIINEVKEYIESLRPACSGDLTVVSATGISININANVKLENDSTNIDTAKKSIEESMKAYLSKTALGADHVSYSKTGAIIQATDNIEEYSNLLINNDTSNIAIGQEEVAIVGVVDLG